VLWFVAICVSLLVVYVGGMLAILYRSKRIQERDFSPIDHPKDFSSDIDTDIEFEKNMRISKMYKTENTVVFDKDDNEYVFQDVEIS